MNDNVIDVNPTAFEPAGTDGYIVRTVSYTIPPGTATVNVHDPVCARCGVVVADKALHTNWHIEKERSLGELWLAMSRATELVNELAGHVTTHVRSAGIHVSGPIA